MVIWTHEQFLTGELGAAGARIGFLLHPGRSVVFVINPSGCLPVLKHISGTAVLIVTKFVVQIPWGRRSLLLWRRCDMLCGSGFMDDTTFGRRRPYGASGIRIPGRSLMSMNALFLCFLGCCGFVCPSQCLSFSVASGMLNCGHLIQFIARVLFTLQQT